MSRIGRMPIAVPAGVDVKIDGSTVTVKGPKGTLTRTVNSTIKVELDNGVINVTRPDDSKENRSLHGLNRTLIANMVKGVTEGFKKTLIVNGVGWKVAKQGNKVVLNVGFSHPVEVVEIEGITLNCPTITEITVTGISKEKVGQFAAMIRGIREPEPYHGYGIRYSDEVIERKVGKAAGGKG